MAVDPLAGAALVQHRRELERAQEAMLQFHRSLRSLPYRRDHAAFQTFAEFVDAYIGLQLDPLLREGWRRGRDPELVVLYADLSLAKADAWLRIGEARRAEETLADLESRFSGSERMLVAYPIGERHTLEESLRMIRARRWRSP